MEGIREHAEMTTKNPYLNTRFLKSMFNLFSTNLIFFQCISWIKFNFCFCKAAAFASGLVFSYQLAEKAVVDVLVTFFAEPYSEYLISSEEHSLRNAVTYDLRNAFAFSYSLDLLSALPLVFLIYISEVYCRGHVKRIIFCLIVAYSSGLTILAIASSHVFPGPYIDSLIIIIGLVLVALGRAGFAPFARGFTIEQLEAHEPDQQNIDEDRAIGRAEMWWRFASAAGSLVAIPLFSNKWPRRLITTGWVMGITFVMFLLATPLYHKREAAPTIAHKPFTCIRVLWAAVLKRHIEYPSSPTNFFHDQFTDDGDDDQLELWPQAKSLRWIDKAAIIESNIGYEAQEKAGRLCTVTMIQETKYILKLVPMWSAFLVFGMVSVGSSFFVFQGSNFKYANQFLIYLKLFQSIAREAVSNNLSPLCFLSKWVSSKLSPSCLLTKWFPEAKLKQNMMRIWGGMLISILCSAVAWQVEVRRFYHHEMSIWLLTPQFFLLGAMEGLGIQGLEHFTIDDDHLSESMKKHLSAINTFVLNGIGTALIILCVYSSTFGVHRPLGYSNLVFVQDLNFSLFYKYLTVYVTPLNCVYLLMVSIFIYGGIDATQVNDASIVIYRGSDPAQVNQESMSETTVPDAA